MEKVSLCAVGDVTGFFKDPESAFEYTSSVLKEADITFAQNERHYTLKSDAAPPIGNSEITTPENAERTFKPCGFDVMSFASNHCMDLGADIMMETVDALRKIGINVIGAGWNIAEARKPAIFERKGTRVGFLAYCSVMREGYQAGPERAGCAPMRALTLYNQVDFQPGTPPVILTFPNKDDLQAMLEDIKKVKAEVDVLVVSFHWGIHFARASIATYQKEVGHAVIDAGADMILGHHPHVLKGIEVYKGKPIFYSMGNFAFDYPLEELEHRMKQGTHILRLMDLYDWKIDPEWSNYAWAPESRKSMIVKCDIVDKKIQRASFLPVLINQKAQPQVVTRQDKRFEEMLQNMQDLTESQGIKTRFSVEGDEIVVSLT